MQQAQAVRPKPSKVRQPRAVRRVSEHAICGRCGHHNAFHVGTVGASITACVEKCDCKRFVTASAYFGRRIGRSWFKALEEA